MNKAELGQVFTDQLIADYMVSLFELNSSDRILDPCFGGGAFIDALLRASFTNITGCEIDDYWFDLADNRLTNVTLNHGDFLKYQPTELFDGIIMNPPYIRQEKIDDLSEFGITKEILQANPIFNVLPRTANLYMYFVLKAMTLLRPDGEMVVIFPSSWLDARGGKSFKDYLYTEYDVSHQIHIHGEVFEGTALVDVVILRVVNRKGTGSTKVISLAAEEGKIKSASKEVDTIDIGFYIPFSAYASVRRGLTTGFNEAFINPVSEFPLQEYLHPILSSPKDLIGYDTTGARYDSLLLISPETQLNDDVRQYLNLYEEKILETQKPKTMYERIKKGEPWYILNSFSGQGIIFSYFVRNEMKFVVHKDTAVIRDNFYVISPDVEVLLMAAMLNNYYTYYQLEKSGKKYGAGLLKLQRYDIENLKFPDISELTQSECDELIATAEELIKTGNDVCIMKITRILSRLSSVSASEIREEWSRVKMHRLEVKK